MEGQLHPTAAILLGGVGMRRGSGWVPVWWLVEDAAESAAFSRRDLAAA
jgi:hypothetical protein